MNVEIKFINGSKGVTKDVVSIEGFDPRLFNSAYVTLKTKDGSESVAKNDISSVTIHLN